MSKQFTYSILNDTPNGAVNSSSLNEEISLSSITVALENILVSGDIITVNFKADLSAQEQTDLNTLISVHSGNETLDIELLHTQDEAISSNVLTKEGKVLYAKIHGVKADIEAGNTHIFDFPIPYDEIYFFGAEVMQDIIGVADYDIYHPLAGVLEQYGHDVNLGTIKYKRETKFGARLPKDLVMRCRYKNDTDITQEVGINFLMHEIRDPNA